MRQLRTSGFTPSNQETTKPGHQLRGRPGLVTTMIIVFEKPPIFNPEPWYKNRPNPFRDTGWTTIDGYWYESDQLARCILLNRAYMLADGRDYVSFMSLNLELELLPKE